MEHLPASAFYIDDHALLYALAVRAAEQRMGEPGRRAAEEAVVIYGRERGARCALRCLADGQPLTMENYLLYGEWVDDRGWSKGGVEAFSPVYRTRTTTCGWCESWRRADLLDYGKGYCTFIDKNLVFGFNPALELEVGELLSHGGGGCAFGWAGCAFADEEALRRHRARRAEQMPRLIRDFLYHCGHLYSALRRSFVHNFGAERGFALLEEARQAYAARFGEDKAARIVRASEQDFLTV